MQRARRNAAMEHRRGELAYKDTLDKRLCPGCGAEQSYDEVRSTRAVTARINNCFGQPTSIPRSNRAHCRWNTISR